MATADIPNEELRNIRATALSYAQNNLAEGENLLTLAGKFSTFLEVADPLTRQARTTAISYAQSNRGEGEDVLATAKKFADFLEGK